jgi:hypothetical protein
MEIVQFSAKEVRDRVLDASNFPVLGLIDRTWRTETRWWDSRLRIRRNAPLHNRRFISAARASGMVTQSLCAASGFARHTCAKHSRGRLCDCCLPMAIAKAPDVNARPETSADEFRLQSAV